MPRPPLRPPQLASKIFLGNDAVRRGLLTRDQLRSEAWQSPFRGIYADSRLSITHRMRCVAAARWLLPPDTVIAGRSAALFHGGLSPGDSDPVEVLTPPVGRRRSSIGIAAHTGTWDADDVQTLGVVPVTVPARTCWDVACWHDTVTAVVVVDSLLARRAVTVPALVGYANDRLDRRGGQRLLRVAALADGGAESPQESRLRVRLVLDHIPRPTTQHVITDGGRFVARTDLAWPDLKVAVEYDGRWHDTADQFERDRERLNRMKSAGWVVLQVTAKRLHHDFDGFLAELRAVLRDANSRRRAVGLVS